ncbi:endolytic transglycosylase MltG [Mesohalobacter halotolerans]|uniref:Endolytic murein transglycosylase n=1 Tax=Mesohalobacter halotolerans TaxID=1883405 RepID=A0A4U5TNT7_9FLAO|nr:endolytic transglycosylase MltG [Mesohalobacter halotolerans]MBS3737515.1 endolytic transglycosylase MltG [Psychroflexus sp.]TKS55697.1 endolytic transglycosylase MltG [Mesohalobacter halotolerans]
MYIKRILLFIAIALALVLGYMSYTIYQAIFSPNTAFKAKSVSVYISKHDNYDSLIQQLEPVLKDTESFISVAKRKEYQPQAGHYIIKKDMNNNEMVNVLRSQNTPIDITFNNAESLAELSGILASQFDVDSIELHKVLSAESFLKQKQMTPQQSLSLYIPNTYEFYWNAKPKDIQNRLLEQSEKFWNASREDKRKALNLNRLEVSVLASIVQKETLKVDERPKVAGVYINRLKRGMKLQADPTVIYALKQKYKTPDTIIRRVLTKDLKIDSPFNTYKYAGLPPAPLIMPDISSIDAVLNYEQHKYLYFVASTTNPGYHIFAKTLREHNRNARQYRRWINQQQIYR